MQAVCFFAGAIGALGSAIAVIMLRNPFYSVLALIVHLVSMSGLFLTLHAEFIAAAQIVVYVGAVMVLFLFGIMLTRAQIGREADLNNRNWALGIPVAAVLLGLLTWVIIDAFEDTKFEERGPTPTQAIADKVLSTYLVPFLAISFILLAAAIGAIVLARKD